MGEITMKRSIRLIPVLALFMVAATVAWNPALAAPDKNDVTVIGWGGAPACSAQEGEILISNSSSEYWYKVVVT
jgi:hypothetical protein